MTEVDQDLKDTGKEIANGVAKGLISGLTNEKTAPVIAKVLYFLFAVVLIISLVYILVPYIAKQNKEANDSNKYIIDSFSKEINETNKTILEFDKHVSELNSNLAIMKAQGEETRTEQKSIKGQLNDNDKRITKLEILEGVYGARSRNKPR